MLSLSLFAQENAKQGEANPFSLLFPLVIVFGIMYLVVILPAQRREKKQRAELFGKLKKNDEVILNTGIIGIVHTIRENDDEIIIKLEGDAKMRILRSAIATI